MAVTSLTAWAQFGAPRQNPTVPSVTENVVEDFKPATTNQENKQFPAVNSQRMVRAQISAPQATFVGLDIAGKIYQMTKDENGVWTGTSEPQDEGFHYYQLNIDGASVPDPGSKYYYGASRWGSGIDIPAQDEEFYTVKNVPQGSINEVYYWSTVQGKMRHGYVYLPNEYYTNPTKKFPVLYLLHGSGGDENAWLELGKTARIMDNLIARGEAVPMIVVMPNGNIGVQAAPGETPDNLAFRPVMSNEIPSSYKNGTYEASFGEIVSFIDGRYKTVRNRQSRAVAGLSMGGFHSLYISLNHPDLFSWTGLFSAGLVPQFTSELDVYSNREAKLRAYQKKGCNLFWIAIGKEDFLYDVNADFRTELDALGFPYEYHESSRGHLWCNWRQYLLLFAPRLFR